MFVSEIIFLSRLKTRYNMIRAQLKRYIIDRKQQSWREYISCLTPQTLVKEVWATFHKLTGSPRRPPVLALRTETAGETIHDTQTVADMHATHLAHISSEVSLPVSYLSLKSRQEALPLNFTGGGLYSYNVLSHYRN